MSYEFQLFIPEEGKSLEECYSPESEEEKLLQQLTGGSDGELNFDMAAILTASKNFTISEDELASIQGLANRILEFNSDFETVETDMSVEMTHPTGIQVSFFGGKSISVTMPFWYEGEECRRVYSLMWEVCRLLNSHAGYCAYDGQLERYYDFKCEDLPEEVIALSESMKSRIQTL